MDKRNQIILDIQEYLRGDAEYDERALLRRSLDSLLSIKSTSFETEDGFIEWLENIRVVSPDGAITNMKWAPAQVAANAVRMIRMKDTLKPDPDYDDEAAVARAYKRMLEIGTTGAFSIKSNSKAFLGEILKAAKNG